MRSLGHRLGEADMLGLLAAVQQHDGDHRAAIASLTRALALYREAGYLHHLAEALNDRGLAQQLIGDYAAAAANHQQALQMQRDLGSRLAKPRH
jgi:tetratricopeptide (TPR) repeat protein